MTWLEIVISADNVWNMREIIHKIVKRTKA